MHVLGDTLTPVHPWCACVRLTSTVVVVHGCHLHHPPCGAMYVCVCACVPISAPPLHLLLCSFVYSFYSFEYKWALEVGGMQGWSCWRGWGGGGGGGGGGWGGGGGGGVPLSL